ncbi:MAG: DUF262 domain-containing HNH endonuclease family protein [Lachnospiraceae bacterium]|nr:DUF262 domain-containing HNH endonuclease family protein [Lachnospiraceae bacterium]
MDNRFPIESNVVSLEEVLKKHYVIPVYQRPYEWNEKNINDFMNSIFEGFSENKPVFFGTIQMNKEFENDDRLDVVDGHQRLTTFLLFLEILSKKTNEGFAYHDVVKSEELSKALKEEFCMDSRYEKNWNLLNGQLNDFYDTQDNKADFYTDLRSYILKNIYFVCLYTEKMVLSDVVAVFNTINTTGLDLNASDIFKFRYYDFLNKYVKADSSWMEKINDCYELIDVSNKERAPERNDQSLLDMSWVLDVYKHIICAEFGWGFSEVSKSNVKFFEDLFKETRNEEKRKSPILSFDVFENVVDGFVKFWRWIEDERFNNRNYENAIELFSESLIEKSRYSRYWTTPFMVAFFVAYNSDKKDWEEYYIDSLKVNLNMVRFFSIYSVINDRVINVVQNQVCGDFFNVIKTGNIEKINSTIKDTMWKAIRWDTDTPKRYFYKTIVSGLFDNGSRVHFVGCLSALLDEINAHTNLKEIQQKLFNWGVNKYDIEHILAKEGFKNEDEKTKGLMNGIGNLVVLEQGINRSIKDNDVKDKMSDYKSSIYESVKELVNSFEGKQWGIETVAIRRKDELKKIAGFMDEKHYV